MVPSVTPGLDIDSMTASIMDATTQIANSLNSTLAQLQNNPNLSPQMQIQMQQLIGNYTNQMTTLSNIVKEFAGVGKTIASNFSF